MVALPSPILERTETKVGHHVPASVPKQTVAKPFTLVEPIRFSSIIVHFIGEDHGHLHLAWDACGDNIALIVESAISHHDFAHDG